MAHLLRLRPRGHVPGKRHLVFHAHGLDDAAVDPLALIQDLDPVLVVVDSVGVVVRHRFSATPELGRVALVNLRPVYDPHFEQVLLPAGDNRQHKSLAGGDVDRVARVDADISLRRRRSGA